MTRIYAIILLTALGILNIEAVEVSLRCKEACTNPCTGQANPNSTCKKDSKKHKPAERKSSPNEKSCLDCPLCYVFTYQACADMMFTTMERMKHAFVHNNNLSDYYCQHWKPPNG